MEKIKPDELGQIIKGLNIYALKAKQFLIMVLPILSILVVGTLVFFFLYWNYKQKMYMLEHRIEPKPYNLTIYSLLFGVLSFFIGLLLTIFFAIKKGVSNALLGGLIPLGAGIAFLTFFFTTTKISKLQGPR